MDQNADPALSKSEHRDRLVSALADELFLVNAKGEILYVLQDVTRQRQRQSNIRLIAAIEAVISDSLAAKRAVRAGLIGTRADGRADGNDSAGRDLEGLTERECHVLGLVCQGQDDEAMSKILGLARNTVRNHIAALYRKIGVNRRGAAIIWAQQRGITCHEALAPRPRKTPRPNTAAPSRSTSP